MFYKMYSNSYDYAQTPSPFFHFPLSPEEYTGDLNVQFGVSHQNRGADQEIPSPRPCDLWNTLPESPQESMKEFLPFSPINMFNISEDHTPSLEKEDVAIRNDFSGETTEECTSQDINSESRKPIETTYKSKNSVTSKLKSVLMSRKQYKSESSLIKSSHGSNLRSHSTSSLSSLDSSSDGSTDNQRSRYTPNSALRFPPCFVCGGTASGLHYGVNSCEPCKGFFTRYLRKKEEYKCNKEGKCSITNRLRGNCSACRLKKCLALGMSRQNSRLGRYSLSRRMETIMQVNELERKTIEQGVVQNYNNECVLVDSYVEDCPYTDDSNASSKSSNQVLPIIKPVLATVNGSCKVKAASGFSNKLVKTLVELMIKIEPYGEDLVTDEQVMNKLKSHYESYKLKISLFGNLTTIPKDEYFNLLKGFGIEIDKRMTFLKEGASGMMSTIERYCNFAKQIPNFQALSSRDQSNLLKSSRYDFFMILMHEGYLHEEQVFLAHNGVAFHLEEVADKFFSRKLVINVCDMYYRLQNLRLSKEEKALLIAISLVFTDRCSLENPNLVQQIQISLTQLLQRQLEKTCLSSALKRFTKIIDCLTVMRESSELFLKEYNQLCNDEMVIEEVPIMTELLFEDK